jgi:mannose-6-phosphate isomerase
MIYERPVKLAASFSERPWGRTSLGAWFPAPARRTGEVWLTGDPPLPLLIKFIFTDEPLSMQVHPGDEYARVHENGSPGKTEMWHILDAEPGAAVMLGFREVISRARLRQAALSGEILELAQAVPVKPGDTVFVPAGTVHALGKGITLVEIQQHSDVTYRLYDYGRGRELHLDQGVEVSCLGPPPPLPEPKRIDEVRTLLASCRYFATEKWVLSGRFENPPAPGASHILIALQGTGAVNGERVRPGQAWLVPEGSGVTVEPDGEMALISTYKPRDHPLPVGRGSD